MAKSKPKPYDTIDALIEAMQDEGALQYSDADGGAMTAREIAQRMNISTAKVMEMLYSLKGQGKLEVMKVWREQIDGVTRRVVAYRVKAQ